MDRATASAAPLAAALEGIPDLTVRRQEPLARATTLRIGGPAELLVEARREGALRRLLAILGEAGVPFFLLGLGSNLLIPDEGIEGVVVRLGGSFGAVRVRGLTVSAGAAVPLARLARRLAAEGLVGFEALAGFPSSVGGAVFMNAGCYGTEIKDLLLRVAAVTPAGELRRLSPQELQAGYRSTILQRTGWVVTRATFRLQRGDAAAALARIEELNRRRWASLPSGLPNAGSVFKNPPGDYAGRLIEACGLKGLRAGAAEISPQHANVIVNTGGARAADVFRLMLRAREAVAAKFGVRLEPEIVLAGKLAERWRSGVRAP